MRKSPYFDKNQKNNRKYQPFQQNPLNDFRKGIDLKFQLNHSLYTDNKSHHHTVTERKSNFSQRPITGKVEVSLEKKYLSDYYHLEQKNFRLEKNKAKEKKNHTPSSATNKKTSNNHNAQLYFQTKFSNKVEQHPRSNIFSQRQQNSYSTNKPIRSNYTARYQEEKKNPFLDTSATKDSKYKDINYLKRKLYQLAEKSRINQKKFSMNHSQRNQQFFQYIMRYSYRSKKGYSPTTTKINQDSYIIFPNVKKQSWEHFFGVCDGHGNLGHHVSQYIKHILPQSLQMIQQFQSSPKQNLFRAYQLTFKKLVKQSNIDLSFSGSTVIGCYFIHNKLFSCNVGDSRAIIGYKDSNQNWYSKALSRDHKPSDQKQADRILKCNGRIQSFSDAEGNSLGPLRVWLKDQNVPGLAMTRSFGDLVAASVGVIWQPEILEHTLTKRDKIIIIASDGVWQFLSNDQIIKQLIPYYQKNKIQEACDLLMQLANLSWKNSCSIIDDISFILIFMNYQN